MEGRLPSKLQKQKARGAGRTMNECKLRGPIDGADHGTRYRNSGREQGSDNLGIVIEHPLTPEKSKLSMALLSETDHLRSRHPLRSIAHIQASGWGTGQRP